MNDETFDMVERLLEMLSGAGEGAFWLLLIIVFRPYVITVAVIIGVIMAVKYVANAINESFRITASKSDERYAYQSIAAKLGVILSSDYYVRPSDMDKIHAKIKELKEHKADAAP